MWLYDKTLAKAREDAEFARGTTARALMERASAALAREVENLLGTPVGRCIVVFCGTGGNAGDGYGAARLLRESGAEALVYAVGEPAGLAAEMRDAFTASGGTVEPFTRSSRESIEYCSRADAIVDALYGVGFHGKLGGAPLEAVRMMNVSRAPVVSADLPSGVESDGYAASEDTVCAAVTVALDCLKPAHCIDPGRSRCGRVVLADIGVSTEAASTVKSDTRLLSDTYLDEVIKPRRRVSHKGDYGRVLVIGGSIGYTGAPQLAAEGALRVGAGLVSMSAPECVYQIMAGGLREVMCFPAPSSGSGYSHKAVETILERAEKCDAVVLGPGLGRSKDSDRLALDLIAKLDCTLILDADGINAAAANINVLRERKAPTVVTPHDVEFTRLGGSLAEGRLAGARKLASYLGATVVLKGSATVVAHPDGSAFVSNAGNPGMATGGSGDVLAGVIAGLAAQGLPPLDAAAAGEYLHATAGDLAADELGEFGMLPSDLLRHLPLTLKRFSSRD